MHITSLAATVLALALPVFAQVPNESLSYNNKYGDANLPVSELACSIPLEERHYTTLGSIPSFPFVGGAYTVVPPDLSACDTCYALTSGNTTIYLLVVDSAPDGFVTSEEVMNVLTDGVGGGRISVTAVQVDPAECGF